MCKNLFGGGSGAAERALAQSQLQAAQLQAQLAAENRQRERNIRGGKKAIDDAFSRFGDDYYDRFRQNFVGAQNPQIDYQYARANDKLAAALAGRGVERSTIAGNAFGDTAAEYAGARGKAANDAFDAANKLRERIEDARTQLYGINTGSTDPASIATQAAARSTALTPLPTTSSVGDIFGAAVSPFVNAVAANRFSPAGGNWSGWGVPAGRGSGSYVG